MNEKKEFNEWIDKLPSEAKNKISGVSVDFNLNLSQSQQDLPHKAPPKKLPTENVTKFAFQKQGQGKCS